MIRMTCVRCPVGCKLIVEEKDGEIIVSRNMCPRGREFAVEELKDPKRILPTSVKVEGGEYPLVSVKTSKPIPKSRIFDVMEKIKKLKVRAPVKVGDVLLRNVLGLGADVVATRNVEALKDEMELGEFERSGVA